MQQRILTCTQKRICSMRCSHQTSVWGYIADQFSYHYNNHHKMFTPKWQRTSAYPENQQSFDQNTTQGLCQGGAEKWVGTVGSG
jgi:hypothetical protein